MKTQLAVITLPILSSIASGQCEWTSITSDPPTATDAYYVYRGTPSPIQTYSPTAPDLLSFTPDRRPGIWMVSYSGIRDCNHPNPYLTFSPLGMAWFWAQAQWDNDGTDHVGLYGLKQRLNDYIDDGFRRVIFNRPGGRHQGNLAVQQSMYDYLSDDHKYVLEHHLAGWIDDTVTNVDADFEFGVFIGSWQTGSPTSPALDEFPSLTSYWDATDDESDYSFNFRSDAAGGVVAYNCFFDPESQSSMQETYQNIIPWIDIGCTAIWLDNSALSTALDPNMNYYDGAERTTDLLQSPDYSGIKISGEAIPRVSNSPDPGYSPDPDYTEATAWVVHWDIFVNNYGWNDGSTTVDASKTEVVVIVNKSPSDATFGYDISDLATVRDSGFLLWVSSNRDQAIAMIQRLYDGDDNELFDAIATSSYDITDFDADGDTDCDDWDLFYSNLNNSINNGSTYNGYTYDSVWDGDINGDGSMNYYDLVDFLALHDWSSCS